MKIAVSVSSSRSVPFFQGEGCHWFAVRGQGNTHDTAGFCHKAHPSDAVLLSHGMENVSNLDCHVESVLFHYRKMFFRCALSRSRVQDFNGFAGIRDSCFRSLSKGLQHYIVVFVSQEYRFILHENPPFSIVSRPALWNRTCNFSQFPYYFPENSALYS